MLLDEMLAENVQTEPALSTARAVARFGRSLPFRGLLKNVQGLDNNELLNAAGLGWKVGSLPVVVQGRTEQRLAKDYQAVIRYDSGAILDITSKQFKPHQNSEILSGMQQLAEAGDAEICYAGPLDGGRKVVAIARMNGEFSLPDKTKTWNGHSGNPIPQDGEDTTALFTIISGGHEVGTPFKIRGLAFRQWCGNGAFFTVFANSTLTISHRLRLTMSELARIKRTYESIREEFSTYARDAARLQAVEMEKENSRLYVAELLKPGIAAELGERLKALPSDASLSRQQVWAEVADSLRGRQTLDAIIMENEQSVGFARSGRNLLDAIVQQDGPNGRNLWSGYNGVTWYVDHQRGRNPETGMDAALFGEGARLKESALATALQFAN